MPKKSVEIIIEKDNDLENYIKKVDSIFDIYGGIEIKVNNVVLEEITSLGIFITMFLVTCLSSLSKFKTGSENEFGTEYLDIVFKPYGNDIIKLVLKEKGKIIKESEEFNLKDFTLEVITVAENYLEYVFRLRPDIKNNKETEKFIIAIENTKKWYSDNYK